MIYQILTWLPRRQFRRATDRKIREIKSTLETIREGKARALKNGSTSLVIFHDASLYLLLLSLDHSTLLYDLVVERNETRKRVHAKHLILLFSEFFDDFPEVFGTRIRETVERLPHSEQHIAALAKINMGLRKYRKTHEKDFYRIRNIVAAHRDLDGELQLSTFEAIDTKIVQKLAGDFEIWFQQVVSFISTVLFDYSKSMQMVREVCEKIEQRGASHKSLRVPE